MSDSLSLEQLALMQMTEMIFKLEARFVALEGEYLRDRARRDREFYELSLVVGRLRSARDEA